MLTVNRLPEVLIQVDAVNTFHYHLLVVCYLPAVTTCSVPSGLCKHCSIRAVFRELTFPSLRTKGSVITFLLNLGPISVHEKQNQESPGPALLTSMPILGGDNALG